ncbi:hypothetical protein CPC08DRAFT_755482 [Agrocybe pediades]|nr:hypothetical protein CPC08DRAFT_755482 [Agrocybe pediades]
MASQGISAVKENMVISSNLNSTLVAQFFMGMYTTVFASTVYLYVSPNRPPGDSPNRIVIATLTIIYVITLLIVCLNWWGTALVFVTQANTRFSLFVGSVNGTNIAVGTVLNIAASVGCGGAFTHVDDQYEFMHYRWGYTRLRLWAHTANTISGVKNISIVATSLTATLIICYQIYSRTMTSGLSRKYKRIMDVLIQSSALYSSVSIVQAVSGFTNGGNVAVSTSAFTLGEYATVLMTLMAGLSPTLMVGRLAIVARSQHIETSADCTSGTCSSDQGRVLL